MPHHLLSILLVATACVPKATTPRPLGDEASSSAIATRPALTVIIVVDQLRGDEPQRYAPLWSKGMKRLLAQGRVFTRAMHGHARTETAAGHASIATGLHPRWHGIIDKRLYEANGRGIVNVCSWGQGPCDPSVLLEPTLGDRLKSRSPQSVVVSVAGKDRAASLMGGQRADLVAWFQWHPLDVVGRTALNPGVPSWLTEEMKRAVGDDRRMKIWNLPELPVPFSEWPDEHPDEVDRGHGTTFPHVLPPVVKGRVHRSWFYTPDPDRVIAELGLAAAFRHRMGRGGEPDLLWISLSSMDLVGHTFGPDSLERAAMMIALDETLGRLLDELERLTEGGLLVALTSDHGVAPTAKHAQQAGHHVERISRAALHLELERAMQAELGPGNWIAAVLPPHIFIDTTAAESPRRVVDAAVSAARSHRMIHEARAAESVVDGRSEIDRLLRENNHASRGSRVLFAFEPHHGLMHGAEGALGAQHGTLWQYDRHVPVILWGEGVVAGRIDDEVSVTALTRTIADRLGLEADPRWPAPLP